MKRKLLCKKKLDSSLCMEFSDREAEALQGGAIESVGNLKSVPPLATALVLLFANPFA